MSQSLGMKKKHADVLIFDCAVDLCLRVVDTCAGSLWIREYADARTFIFRQVQKR